MRVELNYGRGTLPVELPDGLDVQVIRKPAMPVLPDPRAATAEALARPVGAPPLGELARRRENCCILIFDITRPVPNGTILAKHGLSLKDVEMVNVNFALSPALLTGRVAAVTGACAVSSRRWSAAMDNGRYERFARFLQEKGLVKAMPPVASYAVELP
jgi:hypothetical protein